MKKPVPNIYSLQIIHCELKDTTRKKVKSWKSIYCANTNQKKTKMAMLIPKLISEQSRDGEGHSIIIKWSFNKENIRILNAYAPINRVSK